MGNCCSDVKTEKDNKKTTLVYAPNNREYIKSDNLLDSSYSSDRHNHHNYKRNRGSKY